MSSGYDNGGQYTRHSILRYEGVFGEGYCSTGGNRVTEWLASRLKLPPEPTILDIGSGLGGFAFHAVEGAGASVVGLDLSALMVEISLERAAERGIDEVDFRLEDVRDCTFEPGTFQLIWSRDSLLHVPDKVALFKQMAPWLSADGQVMITDYACSPAPRSAEFDAYWQGSGYHLLDLETYAECFRAAGYTDVVAEDWTERFIQGIVRERNDLVEHPERFLADFTQEDLDYLVKRWERKIDYCRDGDMVAALLTARPPR